MNWALEPIHKAVVFIHGFNGSSLETFGSFNDEFRTREEYKGRDVYFFGYDSLFDQISNSALNFLKFLRRIHDDLPEVVKESGLGVKREEPYSEIVIVCHSLGAVVTRVALNEGSRSNAVFLDKCRLVLFAPAHQGAMKVLGNFGFPGSFAVLGPALRYFVVTFDQLIDRNIIITDMESKCRDLINNGRTTFTIAEKVIWASPDRVVVNKTFLDDPEPVVFPGNVGHVKVCKPTQKFPDPLNELQKVLV
ncbi:esterase/lipase family protein [Pedobacter sp. 22163]|uniref:esterase/lipase family protein n=1 Tax=Pedobacter sp. 22163 TaxID=3453883 RepID=UPI003F8563A0